MARTPLTPEQKQKQYATQLKWREENKTQFDETMHSWYLANKTRLNARRSEVRRQKKTTAKIDY